MQRHDQLWSRSHIAWNKLSYTLIMLHSSCEKLSAYIVCERNTKKLVVTWASFTDEAWSYINMKTLFLYFASLRYGDIATDLLQVQRFHAANASSCNMSCAGDHAQTCGGSNFLNLYVLPQQVWEWPLVCDYRIQHHITGSTLPISYTFVPVRFKPTDL